MRLYKVQHISAICGSILYYAAFEFGLYHLLHLRSASRISSVVERLLSGQKVGGSNPPPFRFLPLTIGYCGFTFSL